MKLNRKMKILIAVILLAVATFLVKTNVTATKEKKNRGQNLNLEISSETVQNIYSKLTLLEDDLKSDNYKYSYFRMDDEQTSKNLSYEEKFYIAIENMYQEGQLETERSDDVEKVVIEEEVIIEKIAELFKDEEFNPRNLNYLTALNCGLVGYLYTGSSYELEIRACRDEYEIAKNKIVSATKEGNFIKLKLKSFYATKVLDKKAREEIGYVIKNYNSDEEIGLIDKDEIDDEDIFDRYAIDSFVFSFELQGDDYVLVEIERL